MSPLCHHHAGHRHGLQCILPPYILDWLEETGDADDAAAVAQTLASLALVRQKRVVTAQLIADPDVDTQAIGLLPKAGSAIKVYDAHGLPFTSFELPGTLLRSTDDPPVSDTQADQAFDGARDTLDFYSSILNRNGIDDHGMDVISSVHVSDQDGSSWANAAWTGYPDGLRRGREVLQARLADLEGRRHRPRADARRDRAQRQRCSTGRSPAR